MENEWIQYNGGQTQVRNNYDAAGVPAGALGQVMPGAMAAASQHNSRETWRQQRDPNYVPQYAPAPVPVKTEPQDSNVVVPVVESTTESKKGRPADFPYLLSTTATLAKAGIRYYDGKTFNFNCRHNRKYNESGVYRVFTALFHNVIIPNAIIAREGNFSVSIEDVQLAIKYGMKHSKSDSSIEVWRNFITTKSNEWFSRNIQEPFEWYALGIRTKEDGTKVFIPREEQYTVEKYLSSTDAGRFTTKNRQHAHSTTPGLNRLVNEFAKDRTIAELTYKELVERFGVSRTTAKKFRDYLEQRRAQGFTDGDFTVKPR